MTTLHELNNYSDGTVTYTDNRTSDVIFNYPGATDITETINSTTFDLKRNIDIVEIIKPSQALVTFTVDVSSVSSATVTFPTMPSGVSLTQPSTGVYEISGITSAADWDIIKIPSITVPADTQGNFEFTCTIGFTRDGVRRNESWTIGNFKAVAAITATSTVTANTDGGMLRGAEAHPIMVITMQDVTIDLAIRAVFTVSAEIGVLHDGVAGLEVSSTLDTTDNVDGVRNLAYTKNAGSYLFDRGTSAYFDGQPASGGLQASRLSVVPNASSSFVYSGAFTMECFFFIESDTGNASSTIFSSKTGLTTAQEDVFILWRNADRKLQVYAGGDMNVASATQELAIDQWHHVALVRDTSGNLALFVNGLRNQLVTGSTAPMLSTNRQNIGIGAFLDNQLPLNVRQYNYPVDNGGDGYIDEVRFSSIARYDPTQAQVSEVVAGFQDDSDTQLLLHMASDNGSTVFTDDSSVRATGPSNITAHGNAQISNAKSRFANSSIAPTVNATADYIKVEVDSGLIGVVTNQLPYNDSTINNDYVEITGTQAEIGGQMGLLRYFPTFDNVSNVSVTFTLRNGGASGTIVEQWKSEIQFVGIGSGIETQTYTFTNSDTFNLPLDAMLYGYVDLIVVGAGGGGAYLGGGGGGGGVFQGLNLIPETNANNRTKTITVGTGGAPGYTYPVPNGQIISGQQGGTSSAFGYQATGGYGGQYFVNVTSGGGYQTVVTKSGGASGLAVNADGTNYHTSNAGATLGATYSGQRSGLYHGNGGGGASEVGWNYQGYSGNNTSGTLAPGNPRNSNVIVKGHGGAGSLAWDGNTYGEGSTGEAASNSHPSGDFQHGYFSDSWSTTFDDYIAIPGNGGRYGFGNNQSVAGAPQGPWVGANGIVIIRTKAR